MASARRVDNDSAVLSGQPALLNMVGAYVIKSLIIGRNPCHLEPSGTTFLFLLRGTIRRGTDEGEERVGEGEAGGLPVSA